MFLRNVSRQFRLFQFKMKLFYRQIGMKQNPLPINYMYGKENVCVYAHVC